MAMSRQERQHANDGTAELEVKSGSSAILHFAGRQLPAVIGSSGVCIEKHEGDGCTPVGCLPLRQVFYRPDRLGAPSAVVPCQPLTEADGWCDDERHADYNRHVQLPHPARHEKLWLEDNVYDVIGVLGYNDDPVVVGRGSAIFLHVVSKDLKPTAGCVSLSLNDLCWALQNGLQAILIPSESTARSHLL